MLCGVGRDQGNLVNPSEHLLRLSLHLVLLLAASSQTLVWIELNWK